MLAVWPAAGDEEDFAARRNRMVDELIWRGYVKDERVIKALREVPRHLFVPVQLRGQAYEDTPLPIGYGQTISAPSIVALMTELLELSPGERVLDVGTGGGVPGVVSIHICIGCPVR